jgi:sacsin
MVPQPKKQMPQRQPLTVALRKICRDYPAGDGILKELLQNADDAGASTVVRLTLFPESHRHSNSPRNSS